MKAVLAVTFCSLPLYEFSENLQLVRGLKMFSTTLASLAFLNSRQGTVSSGVYNSSSSNAMFGKKDVTTWQRDLRTQSNLRTSLRSSVYSVYYRTGHCRIKGVLQRPAVKDISQKSPCLWNTSVESHLVCVFFHTYMHTYIHTYVRTYIHTCIYT